MRSGVSGSVVSTSSPLVRWATASTWAERSWRAARPVASREWPAALSAGLGVVVGQQFGVRLRGLGKLRLSTWATCRCTCCRVRYSSDWYATAWVSMCSEGVGSFREGRVSYRAPPPGSV